MLPLLVEYSEDDDPGCGLGAIVILGVVALGLLFRLATGRSRRQHR